MASDQVPKEAKVASLLLNSSGIQECEPKVVQQIMEFMFSTRLNEAASVSKCVEYSTDVLQLASVYGEHANKSVLDSSDVRLAIKTLAKKGQSAAVEREVTCALKFAI
jgi:transcription initiation factor TFIID subunit 9B